MASPAFEDYRARALNEGYDEVLVRSWPADLQIDTGDGHGFTCAGARPHTDDCSYTYAWSSRHDPSGRSEVVIRRPQ